VTVYTEVLRWLGSGHRRGIMGVDDVKNGVRFNCIFIVDLII
jgi:hypothetical protein